MQIYQNWTLTLQKQLHWTLFKDTYRLVSLQWVRHEWSVLVNKAQRTAIFFYENGSRGREVLTDFLGDAELKSIMSDGYNAYVFIGDELKSARFKDTIHQVCMSHARNKFVKASNRSGELAAERFPNILKNCLWGSVNVMMPDSPRKRGFGKGKVWKRKDSW